MEVRLQGYQENLTDDDDDDDDSDTALMDGAFKMLSRDKKRERARRRG